MPFGNYTQLQASIANTLNRDDLTAQIPDFIALAEAMFNRELRWRKMVVQDVIANPGLTDEVYENLPSDFLELKSIRFNTDPGVSPDYLTPTAMERHRGANPGLQGTPRYYTLIDTRILFDRTPTGAPELDISSYVKIPALNDSTQTSNLLLEEHPDLYLYGSLMHAEPFLKNDERIAVWGGMYSRAKDALHKADRRAEKSPSPMAIRPRRGAFGGYYGR